jgi:hypothetical protein
MNDCRLELMRKEEKLEHGGGGQSLYILTLSAQSVRHMFMDHYTNMFLENQSQISGARCNESHSTPNLHWY